MAEFLIAHNPDPDSRLPISCACYLAPEWYFAPPAPGRAKASYCYPVGDEEWPDELVIIERVRVRRGHRPHHGPVSGESLPAGVHYRSRPRSGFLVVTILTAASGSPA